jgi:hypothetical protein
VNEVSDPDLVIEPTVSVEDAVGLVLGVLTRSVG